MIIYLVYIFLNLRKRTNLRNLSMSNYVKKILFFSIIVLISNSCFWDEQKNVIKISKEINLAWYFEPRTQALFYNHDSNYGGITLIEETIFAIGANKDFIILKQHPNKEAEISQKIFREKAGVSTNLLKSLGDTSWIEKGGNFYYEKGKWYPKSNGWSPPRWLYPYKKITNYYIIDLRNYDSFDELKKNIYKFSNNEEFTKKRDELGIPSSLSFKVRYKGLE